MTEPMKTGILKVLKEWGKPNGDFDAMWHGYDSLLDELRKRGHRPTLKEIKNEMKSLAKSGKVEMLPLHDDEYKLSGKGWFLAEKLINANVEIETVEDGGGCYVAGSRTLTIEEYHRELQEYAAQQVAAERERMKKELGKSIIEHEYELDFPGDPVINVSVLFKLIDSL